ILVIVAAAISNQAVVYGYGLAEGSLEYSQEAISILYSAIGQAIVTLGATAGRLAFILYLIELLAARRLHRIILWLLVPSQIIINLVSVFLLFFQCDVNLQHMYDWRAFKNCMSLVVQIDYAYFQGAFNSACDLLLAVFPIYIFWRFNWSLRVKLVLISLLSLGVVAMAASLVKTIEYPTIMISTDPRTNRVTLLRWMFIEAGVVLITASIPCLRPLVVHWTKKILKRVPERHQKMPGDMPADRTSTNASTLVNIGQMTQDWKSRWIMPFTKQEQPREEEVERHILQNITTHIFAGDREFLDRHIPGIVRQVEVTVVTDEIPLTDTGSHNP
ncbi:hypothetical protein BO71DRAFT_435682, partial [Aspergillus ellipticus CBS 707.79]